MAVLYDRVHSTVEAIVSVMIGFSTWRSIPFSKWFSNHGYSSKSPNCGCSPSKQPNWDDPPRSGLCWGQFITPLPAGVDVFTDDLSGGLADLESWESLDDFSVSWKTKQIETTLEMFWVLSVWMYIHILHKICRDIDTESMHPPIFGTIPSVVGQELV